jgi:hypothetical protein
MDIYYDTDIYEEILAPGNDFDFFNIIYERTERIMFVDDSENITFENCVFDDNQELSLVYVNKTLNMSLSNCRFENNRGGAMFSVKDATVSVRNSTFSNNEVEEDIPNSTNVDFIDCDFK